MTASAAQGVLDDAHRVRLASLSLPTPLSAVNTTAVNVRSQWLGLAQAYFAPEADEVLRGMDRPAHRAAAVLDAATAAQSALLDYADRLAELAGWPAITTAEMARLEAARAAAEWVCAAALQAIPRPEPTADTFADHPGPTPIYRLATTPAGPSRVMPQHGSLRQRWIHPQQARPGSLRYLIDEWAGLAPPKAEDPGGQVLYTLSMLGFAAETRAAWMVTVEHGSFKPRDAHGRYVPVSSLSTAQRLSAGAGSVPTKKGLTYAQRLRSFTPGGTFEAKGHRGAARTQWMATANKWGRANAAVTVASSGLTAWQDNAGFAPDERIGRTATQGAAAAGGAVAGGQAGALVGSAIGTAIMPGAGTVVGATVGGLVGGFAGSEVGGWVGDQLVDIGGEAGDLIGDALTWSGEHTQDLGGDLLDVATFWD